MSGFITPRRFGVIALVGAIFFFALGFKIYGPEMGPHALAALAAILLETAFVVLVLDWLTQRQKQQDWSFVRNVVGRRMAACMVDVVRLWSVRWGANTYVSNASRYDEFIHIAQLHFADLRTSIEGLVIGAAPIDYERARTVELGIDWIIDKLAGKPDLPQAPFQIMQSTIVDTRRLVHTFLTDVIKSERCADSIKQHSALCEVVEIVASMDRSILDKTSTEDMDTFVLKRMAAQNEFLRRWRKGTSSTPAGIWFDVN